MKVDISELIIDQDIFDIQFSCDIDKCKGSCCTIEGTIGAPLLKEEVKTIEEVIPVVDKYLSERNKKQLYSEGFLFMENRKSYSLSTINDNDCIFSFYDEKGNALCAFQKAYLEGEIKFKKPISCDLFPIRISGRYDQILRYEEFEDCKYALEKGSRDYTSIFDFAKDALIRKFGKETYYLIKEKFVQNA